MERPHFGLKEQLAFNLKLGLSLIAISALAFSPELKQQVRKEQNWRCDCCGLHQRGQMNKLTIHHRQPQSMGGKDVRSNAVGLDRKCHDLVDNLTLRYGLNYEQAKSYLLEVYGLEYLRSRGFRRDGFLPEPILYSKQRLQGAPKRIYQSR